MHWSADLPHRDRQAPDRCFVGTQATGTAQGKPVQPRRMPGASASGVSSLFLTRGASRLVLWSKPQRLSIKLCV